MTKPDRERKLETAYLLKKTRPRRTGLVIAISVVVALAAAAALWFNVAKIR